MNKDDDFSILSPTNRYSRWGDYGRVLCDGYLDTVSGEPPTLRRVGPMIPPITFPAHDIEANSVVVTETARRRLEGLLLNFPEHNFVPVKKGHIVKLPWEDWDRGSELSFELLPQTVEPADYILHNPHSEEAADQTEDLWNWIPPVAGKVLRDNGKLEFVGMYEHSYDIFVLDDRFYRSIFVNQRGREIVSNVFADWL
ncbi:MAG: hypothetical protein AAF394_01360, partial [Planctomycetota bacterium]